MQITQDYNTKAFSIRTYKTGEIAVFEPVVVDPESDKPPRANTRILKEHFIVYSDKLIENWNINKDLDGIENKVDEIVELKPELLILGTGETTVFPPPTLFQNLHSHGIGVEVMDTAAACRTYNFLVADGRDVAAALIII